LFLLLLMLPTVLPLECYVITQFDVMNVMNTNRIATAAKVAQCNNQTEAYSCAMTYDEYLLGATGCMSTESCEIEKSRHEYINGSCCSTDLCNRNFVYEMGSYINSA
ncbi:hypothetical protein PFISCL1PPCAC_7390, partial [Pristionchus fissidentatus]